MLKNSNTVSHCLQAPEETVIKNLGEAFSSPYVSTNLHDRRDADNGRYSQNRSTVFVEARQETIDWLVANNFPALPVAPQQEPHKYPKRNKNGEIEYEGDGTTPKPLFTGKNPSYLDKGGNPHLINHHKYRERLPTQKEYDKWFGNPQNGVGTLGGWNDATWIDLDVKNFESASDCEAAALEIIEKLAAHFPYFEKTHSGGYRILISHPDANKTTKECQSKITNFALEPGGKHVGECLSKGRFTVLAPTVGTSGNSYENINRAKPVPVGDLADIGIYSSRSKQRKQSTTKTKSRSKSTKSSPSTCGIDLEKLITPNAKQILYGNSTSGDRSADLAAFIQEVYGWLNWCNQNNIPFSGDAYDLSSQAGEALGIDLDRIDRILDGIDLDNCIPAAEEEGGTEACWKKIKSLDKAIYRNNCQDSIKNEIDSEQKKYAEGNIYREYEVFKKKYDIKLDITEVEDKNGNIKLKIPLQDLFEADKVFGNRIKYNEMLNEYEVDKNLIDWNLIRLGMEKEGVNFSSQARCESVVREIGERNKYSPVRDYLNSLPAKNSDLLENIATRYLGVPESDHLSNTFLRKWLIGSVKRVLEPGCCMDYMLVLSGKPHCGKTQFFQNLASEDWFTSSFRDIGNKDNLRLLREFWVLELGEVDQYLNARTSEEYKSFISTQVDTYRVAYGRGNKRYPRTCAIAGTTNRGELLKDETGNRRYFMITIPDEWKIERERIISERDEIWSAAVAAYKSGESIFLTPEQMEALNERNKEYMEHDVWQDIISAYLNNLHKDWVTGVEVIEMGLKMSIVQAGRKEQNRVGRIMRILGWEKKSKRINGKFQKVYSRPVTVATVTAEKKAESLAINTLQQCDGILGINNGHTTVTPTVTPKTLTNSTSYNSVTVVTVDNKDSVKYSEEKSQEERTATCDCGISFKTENFKSTIPNKYLTKGTTVTGTTVTNRQNLCNERVENVTVKNDNGHINERIGVSGRGEGVTVNGHTPENLKIGAKIHCYPTQESKEQNREVLATIEKIDSERKLLEISWGDCKGFIGLERVVGIVPVPKWYEI